MRTAFNLFKDTSGNFALTFGILAVPVMVAGGLAVDYVGLSVEKSQLQNAVDSAALSVAREGKLTEEEALTIARSTVAVNYGLHAAQVSVKLDGDTAIVSASMEQPLVFGGFMGKKTAEIAVEAQATYAYTKYEIALVLDTTGSMAGGKLVSLQNAVIGLVAGMADLGLNKDQIKFSLVPYSGFVNVGPENGPEMNRFGMVTKPGASWLDHEGAAPIPQSDLPEGTSRFALYNHLGSEWPGCVETRMASGGKHHDVDDTEPSAGDPHSLFTPFFAIDEPDTPYAYPNSYLADVGVPVSGQSKATSRRQAQLARYRMTGGYTRPTTLREWIIWILTKWRKPRVDDSPSAFYSNKKNPKGPDFGCETEPLVPLTTDLNKITATVKKLKADGSTNMLEGVMWGWRVLSDREPFAQGAPKSDKSVEKIMIFLTDGQNSFGNLNNALGSAYTSMGYLVDGRLNGMTAGSIGQTNNALDEKTLTACTNAKKDGVTIYTIRLEESDIETGTMLQQCASSKEHFFDAPSRQQLAPIFEAIQKGVVKLRLTS
ncbi:pilus assembly protein [uncultured Hoeflea sp.]|uniref:pilus assembly protein n=1 Tax=uncultured Hoeflea sp. TaxID=538666 RepID=UPI00263521F3|nr:pilus assembly protein [uncultured Hoeflea sp.]